VGEWTVAETLVVSHGDVDAVSVGDYHLKNIVAWHLAGEERGSDERMLELLEPFRPHRARVVRLLEHAGAPQRKGPRLAVRGFQRY
jgi:3-methyladenine DNA glycosylase/8-oxoguanine DNA glycosylase